MSDSKQGKSAQNWESRDIWSLGPKFRIDVSNPQQGSNGAETYAIYAVNDNKDVNLCGLTEGGTYRIFNDRSIEIVAGQKNKEKQIDITISGQNGDVCITAMRNGAVRIKGKNIVVEATEDLDMKAGRNINLNAGSGRVLLNCNKADIEGLTGTLIEKLTGTFGMKVFEGSFVGADLIKEAFTVGKSFIGGL
jgi:hypothetical protein